MLAFFGTLLGAQRILGDETCPLDAMARSGAVRLELVIRLVMVAFEIRLPIGGEMLRNTPVIVGCPSDHMIDDTTSALAVFLVSGHIGNGKECFGGVHIGIDAAIGVKLGEFRVPSIDGQTDLVIPEMLVVGCQSLFEQLVRVRAADKLGGSGGKNHESVGVADLACFMGGAVCGNGRIPSAVFIVMQRTAQAGDGLVNQFCGARLAVQEPQGIHVRHAAGDPRVDVLGQIRIAGIVQPVGATLRGGEIVSEMQELVGFRLEQGMVFFGAEHVGFGRVSAGHRSSPSLTSSAVT